MYPGAGYEWFSIQHWIALQQDGFSVGILPLDSSLATFGDINRGQWLEKYGERQGTVFSYIMNNYWHTNYRASQGGHFTFRYVLTSGSSLGPAELSRLGWEESTPLEANLVTTQDKALGNDGTTDSSMRPGALPTTASGGTDCMLNPKQESFLNLDGTDVLLETWKPAEDGRGTILRFLNLGEGQRTVTAEIPRLHLDRAWETDAVERDQKELSLAGKHQFNVAIGAYQIASIRVLGRDECKLP
jgi:hypothetical protein